MPDVLSDFQTFFLPHVRRRRAMMSDENFGCSPNELMTLEIRRFVERSELLTHWLRECVPRSQGNFRLGVGCDPKPLSELDQIYSVDGAIPQLAEQRIFIFAEDGSGLPYCIHVDSGEVFRTWSAWGSHNDRSLEEVIDQQWKSLEDFTGWLQTSFSEK